MKRNAVARIVIYSIVILLLVALLLAGLGIGSFAFDLFFDSGDYQTGSSSVPADSIRNIKIEWGSGDIAIRTKDIDTISFTEEGDFSDDQQMVYSISGNTLTIRCAKSGIHVGFVKVTKKNLIVTVPSDWECGTMEIEVASADLCVENLTAETLDLETASGKCDFVNCNIQNMNVDTASGDISYTGTMQALDCNTASARFTGVFSNVPSRMELDCASGDYDITLPENAGFRVDMDALSGKFSSDFATTQADGAYICGDGRCKIEFDGASGDIIIRKAS